LKPDMVVYLTLSAEAMAKRGGFGVERYETNDFQRNVKKMYERMIEHPLWQVIDADKTEDKLSEELEQLIKGKIAETGELPLLSLW
jgi:dTMP kinase